MEKVKIKIITSNNHEYYMNIALRVAPGFTLEHAFDNYIREINQSLFLKISNSIAIFTKHIVSIEMI